MRFPAILAVCLGGFFGIECNTNPGANRPVSGTDEKTAMNVAKYEQGKSIFRKYCNTCHYAPEKNVLDQYTFDNLFERLPPPAEEYFSKYIRDSKSLRDSGNKRAIEIQEARRSDYEHNFKDSLSLKDITDLIVYIKVAAKMRYK